MKKCFFVLLIAILPCCTFSAVTTARYLGINIRNNTAFIITCKIHRIERGTLTFPGKGVTVRSNGHLRRGLITARMSGGHKARGTLRCILHDGVNSVFYLNYRYEASAFRRFTRQITLEATATSPDGVRVLPIKQRSYHVTSYDPIAKPLITYVV